MDSEHLVTRDGEHAEGVVVAKLGLGRERKAAQVVEGGHVGRMDARGIEQLSVGRNMGVGVAQAPSQPLELQGFQLGSRSELDGVKSPAGSDGSCGCCFLSAGPRYEGSEVGLRSALEPLTWPVVPGSLGLHAAVDDELLARAVRALIAGEVQHHAGDVC